ncbi:MAG: tRNA (N(6)-L-threonylcarbamoyladenosine(37)-C(2))-methylthiotransferase MtaB [Chloroflexi bacterium]|nr:tRNA (N(6)-L-threonylcarbamoyladenosine(37)-C(2))-methylthiotransferase MtaB [Chloroflexota bacterium]
MCIRDSLDFLGCRLNQAEIEQMAREFAARGDTIVDTPEEADRVVINTCAVTRNAGKVSRRLIRQAARANPNAAIIATGCYAQIAPEKVASLPNVAEIVDNLDKDRLVPLVSGSADAPYDLEPHQRDPLPPGTLGRTRAFVKVQDGCDNRCTFCVTTLARGAGRSRPMGEVIREINALAQAGYREVVLTGVHLGSWGQDHGEDLAMLVRAVLHRTRVERIRLSSLEPWDLTPDFFELWSDDRLCPHLHLPLQSGSDATLRRMARRTTQAQFSALVEAARRRIPDLCLTTDIIVGFPGETAAEFGDSLDFVRTLGFARLHCFPYSARPGTAAARRPDHVPNWIKKERMQQMLALSEGQWAAFQRGQVGRTAPVLWESARGSGPDGIRWTGYTPHYVPVEANGPADLANTITPVELTDFDGTTLSGTIRSHR